MYITEKANLNAEPFIFAVMIAASVSFFSPLGCQTNVMVNGSEGCRFADLVKARVPMNLVIGVATIEDLLLGWPLTSMA